MKAKDIVVGGKYTAKVSGKLVTVLVQQIYERSNYNGRTTACYQCKNLDTGRELTFRSAAKFRRVAGDPRGSFEGRLKHLAERGAAGLITAEEQDRQHDTLVQEELRRRRLDRWVCVSSGHIETMSGEARSAEVRKGDIFVKTSDHRLGHIGKLQIGSGMGWSHQPGLSGKKTDPMPTLQGFDVLLRDENVGEPAEEGSRDAFWAKFQKADSDPAKK